MHVFVDVCFFAMIRKCAQQYTTVHIYVKETLQRNKCLECFCYPRSSYEKQMCD